MRPARILVIDEDHHVRRSVARVLARDFEVIEVEGAGAALGLVARGDTFDAVLGGLELPELSCSARYQLVLVGRPELVPRVVIMTRWALSEEAARFLERNVRAERRFEPAALRAAIARALAAPVPSDGEEDLGPPPLEPAPAETKPGSSGVHLRGR